MRMKNIRINCSSDNSDENMHTYLNDVSQVQTGSGTLTKILIPTQSINETGNGSLTETKDP